MKKLFIIVEQDNCTAKALNPISQRCGQPEG